MRLQGSAAIGAVAFSSTSNLTAEVKQQGSRPIGAVSFGNTSSLITDLKGSSFGRILANFSSSSSFTTNVKRGVGLYRFHSKSKMVVTVNSKVSVGDSLQFLVDKIPEAVNTGSYQKYVCRFKRNGVEYPVTKFSAKYPSGTIGNRVEIHLARPTDFPLFDYVNGVTYKFELGVVKNGVTKWDTIVDTQKLENKSYSIAWDRGPKDTLIINSISSIDEKFQRTPINPIIMYDPRKVTIDTADLRPIWATNGERYTTVRVKMKPLTFYSVMSYICNACGFPQWKTNIPNFTVPGRVDISLTTTYLEAFSGILGTFKPLMTIIDGVLWILDTTISHPAGFPSPSLINAHQYVTANKTSVYSKVDAYVTTYQENDSENELWFEESNQTTSETGKYGSEGWTRTSTQMIYRKYYRRGAPNVITKELLRKSVTKTYQESVAHLINENTEDFTYDFAGRLTGSNKVYRAEIPDVENDGEPTMTIIRRETEKVTYGPHPTDRNRQIQLKRTVEASGLRSVDPENQMFDEDFEQDFMKAFEGGNLHSGMTTTSGPLWTITESTRPSGQGQVKVYVQKIDHVRGMITNTISAARTGEISTSSLKTVPREMVVWPKVPAAVKYNFKKSFNIGPLPTGIGVPLVQRLLDRENNKNSKINMQYIGYDPYIKIGTVQRVEDRYQNILGNYIVEDLTIDGNDMGNPNLQKVMTSISGDEI